MSPEVNQRSTNPALAELIKASRDYRELVRAPYAPNDAEFEKWYALLGAADQRLSAILNELEDAAWEKWSAER